MARPKIPIDKKQFEKLCSLQCTKAEIAGYFSCSEDTIERWCNREYKECFAVVFSKKRVGGQISLRRSQFQMAEKSPAMAIWLGKQYLGQKEQQEVAIDTANVDDTIKKMNTFFGGNENGDNV